jgi:hypothetical protein
MMIASRSEGYSRYSHTISKRSMFHGLTRRKNLRLLAQVEILGRIRSATIGHLNYHTANARVIPDKLFREARVTSTKPRSARPLPMQNGHLMSQSQHLQFQRGPTPKPKGDQRKHCREDRKQAGHDKPVGAKLQYLRSMRNFEYAQASHTSPQPLLNSVRLCEPRTERGLGRFSGGYCSIATYRADL